MYSNLLFPPQKLFELENNRILVIGMNGEIQILDENLIAEFEYKKPFPTSISISSISKNTLFACWIDLELMIARIASIDLNSKINNGITRAELRRKLESKSQPQVESSKWSNILDSEPLALISNDHILVSDTYADDSQYYNVDNMRGDDGLALLHRATSTTGCSTTGCSTTGGTCPPPTTGHERRALVRRNKSKDRH